MEELPEWWESPGQDTVWSSGLGVGSRADNTGRGQIMGAREGLWGRFMDKLED